VAAAWLPSGVDDRGGRCGGLRIRRLDCTSKKVEVGIHTSTSRLASLCMGLVFEKAVTLREANAMMNKITLCQRFGRLNDGIPKLLPTRALYL
jgi:hypothetical protein